MDLNELMKSLPQAEERKWSYLETIGVAHRETIMANLLAFYFDPEGLHGLDDIFIRALLKTIPKGLKVRSDVERPLKVEEISKVGVTWAKIMLEDSTDDNKRLDILIETDELVIAIEFKINHDLNNPLNSYVERVSGIYPRKEKYYVVLTPQWKEPVRAALEGETKFNQIILSHFVKEVDTLVKEEGKFPGPHETRQHILYNDFLNTIENKKIRINLINKYFDRVKNGDFTHEDIENAYEQFRNHRQFKELKGHIEKKMNSLLSMLIGFSILSSSKNKIESVAYCSYGDGQIKIRLNLKGWAIERWEKGNKKETEEKPHEEPITNLVKEIEKHIILALTHQPHIISGYPSEP